MAQDTRKEVDPNLLEFEERKQYWEKQIAKDLGVFTSLEFKKKWGKIIGGIESLSQTDPLTGILNKQGINNRLEEEISRAKREGRPLTVMVLDLDRFKKLNEEQGHLKGDEALKAVGQILKEETRDYDIKGRWGGDEFVVVCPGIDATDAKATGDKTREALSRQLNFLGFDLSVSIGITVLSGEKGARDLIKEGDQALNMAKREGKNRVTIYNSEKEQAA